MGLVPKIDVLRLKCDNSNIVESSEGAERDFHLFIRPFGRNFDFPPILLMAVVVGVVVSGVCPIAQLRVDRRGAAHARVGGLQLHVDVRSQQSAVERSAWSVDGLHRLRVRRLLLRLLQLIPLGELLLGDVYGIVHDDPRDSLVAAREGERALVGNEVVRLRQEGCGAQLAHRNCGTFVRHSVRSLGHSQQFRMRSGPDVDDYRDGEQPARL
ncbi:hypothetical protein PMAYCL1PPCAC_09707 [Pristionchus mayeri]|uniref:Uncharacterized protein n=1 Tax=Pristionchus mayeri TaxID=1317129 RepID=A0AAN5CDH5_9BILA|nr:hypothetical protein PMAYCL1PPCAC_09707 [Pristionchus mayeri]